MICDARHVGQDFEQAVLPHPQQAANRRTRGSQISKIGARGKNDAIA